VIARVKVENHDASNERDEATVAIQPLRPPEERGKD